MSKQKYYLPFGCANNDVSNCTIDREIIDFKKICNWHSVKNLTCENYHSILY